MFRRIHWLLFAAAVLTLINVAPAFAAGGVVWGT